MAARKIPLPAVDFVLLWLAVLVQTGTDILPKEIPDFEIVPAATLRVWFVIFLRWF
ncbi:hypothetical protein B0F90DRAFT_1710000 [Multifurca ochricompacta]|uniref:Uncharacterized protein n=1 Tax=Multifurca ochricompacta TaxID=376703 RepID=A0AAD4M5K0_9AGAM|nr:hypothetical protein B0F90DRAFT_1710000 [Multifurca ochricompacta]